MGERSGTLEGMVMRRDFWAGKRVFLTGHTGFKGSWTALWLARAGAAVTGYALEPPTKPSLFEEAGIAADVTSVIADLRDLDRLCGSMAAATPDIVIHMAAQPLVRESYADPVATYAVNVMGTVHVLEAMRFCPSIRVGVIVTTDKVYRNNEWVWGYRESDALGGHDPYSSSKACCELVVDCYRASFFSKPRTAAIASVRAGNVIGGGDWAKDRIVSDIVGAFATGQPVSIRNPNATRPWQHVLEPVAGYLCLAERLHEKGADFARAYNFGPPAENVHSVLDLVERIRAEWGSGRWETVGAAHPHEATHLALDTSLATATLGWRPLLSFAEAVAWTVEWYRLHARSRALARVATLAQIERYEGLSPS